MATGPIFQIITGDGRSDRLLMEQMRNREWNPNGFWNTAALSDRDRFLMATDVLQERLKVINDKKLEINTKVKHSHTISTDGYCYKGEMLFDLADGYGTVEFNEYPFIYTIKSCGQDKTEKDNTTDITTESTQENTTENTQENKSLPLQQTQNNSLYDWDIPTQLPSNFRRYSYTGMFLNGKFNGIGVLKDNIELIVSKGQWRENKKQGYFTVTHQLDEYSYKALYREDNLINQRKRQFISEKYLSVEPRRQKSQTNVLPNTDAKCIICYANSVNCTVAECGHTNTCFPCLSKVDKCPTCRVSIKQKIKIFT